MWGILQRLVHDLSLWQANHSLDNRNQIKPTMIEATRIQQHTGRQKRA